MYSISATGYGISGTYEGDNLYRERELCHYFENGLMESVETGEGGGRPTHELGDLRWNAKVILD